MRFRIAILLTAIGLSLPASTGRSEGASFAISNAGRTASGQVKVISILPGAYRKFPGKTCFGSPTTNIESDVKWVFAGWPYEENGGPPQSGTVWELTRDNTVCLEGEHYYEIVKGWGCSDLTGIAAPNLRFDAKDAAMFLREHITRSAEEAEKQSSFLELELPIDARIITPDLLEHAVQSQRPNSEFTVLRSASSKEAFAHFPLMVCRSITAGAYGTEVLMWLEGNTVRVFLATQGSEVVAWYEDKDDDKIVRSIAWKDHSYFAEFNTIQVGGKWVVDFQGLQQLPADPSDPIREFFDGALDICRNAWTEN